MQLTTKLQNTLDVFEDLQNLYYYEENNHGILKTMLDNTLEVLNNPDFDVTELKNDQNSNLLHLAANANNIKFFILAAHKGINPYLKNDKQRNAFQSRHYEFANNLWKKFEHIYFDNQIKNKSFEFITKGFHPLFKQAIYEENIQSNASQYNLNDISKFLKDNHIYSHHNVLSFALKKYDNPLVDLLEFIIAHEASLTPEDNSLALHCGLKHMLVQDKAITSSYMFDMFINEANFAINENFLQSMQISAANYKKPNFQTIFNKQTEILVEKNYNPKNKFEFYYVCHHKQKNKEIQSINCLEELYAVYSLDAVWNYYYIDNKLQIKKDNIKFKKPKI